MKEVLLSLLLCVSTSSLTFARDLSEVFSKAPDDWLKSMSEAVASTSYRGFFVYQEGALLESFRVTHDAKGGRELISYLDGLPREVVRSNKGLTYSSAGKGATRFNSSVMIPMVGSFSAQPLSPNYNVEYLTKQLDRVAGQYTVVLSILPKDLYRYSYQIWLDVDTSLPLKSVMLDSRGGIKERLQFTYIEAGIKLASNELEALEISNSQPNKVVNMNDAPVNGGVWQWEAGWLPEGFVLKSAGQRPSPVSKHQVDTAIYSDGLASFSIFVEPDETRVLSQMSENVGALAAVSKVFRRGDDFFHVTVVGEVPISTAERVAASVRPEKEKLIETEKE